MKDRILSKQFLRYILAGGGAFLFELIILYLFYYVLGMSAELSAGISFWISIFTTFYLQKIFAFKDYQKTLKKISKQLGLYSLLIVFNYVVTIGLVALFPEEKLFISRTIALILTTTWNYFIYKNFIFSEKKQLSKISWKSLKSSMNLKNGFLYIVIALCSATLLAIMSLGIYIRPMSDDYAFLGAEKFLSFFDFVGYSFSANGRVSSILSYIVGYSIPGFLYFVPAIGVVVMLVGLYAFTKSLIDRTNIFEHGRLVSLSLSLFVLVSSLISHTGLYSSLFWFASAPVHAWSYGLLLFYLGMIINNLDSKISSRSIGFYVSYLVLPFVVSTLNETTAITIILLSSFGILFEKYVKRSKTSFIFRAGLYSSLLGFIALYFSPGSIERKSALVRRVGDISLQDRILSLPDAVKDDMFKYIPLSISNKSFFLLLLFFSFIIGAFYTGRRKLKQNYLIFGLLTGIFLLFLHIINISILFIMTARPIVPLRMYYLTTLILSLVTAIIGIIAGVFINQRKKESRAFILGAIVTIIVFMLPVKHYIVYLLDLRNLSISTSIEWDKRDKFISQKVESGDCKISVPRIGLLGVDDLQPTIDKGVNSLMYRYYTQSSEYPYTTFLDGFKPDVCGLVPQ